VLVDQRDRRDRGMTQRRTVAVIGAGIVGVACAGHLLRDGHAVTLIDRSDPGEGCSRGNAGAISPGSCVPLALPGMWRSIPGWLLDPLGPLSIRLPYLAHALPWLIRFGLNSRLSKVRLIADAMRALHAPTFENYAPLIEGAGCRDLIRMTGTLVVYEQKAAKLEDKLDWTLRRERGIRFTILDADDIRQIVPELGPQYEQGVLLPDHGSVVDPRRLVAALAEGLVRNGGILQKHEVRRIAPAGDGRVRVVLDDSEMTVDRVVVAAGAWSSRLLSGLGLHVPLESQRGYHATLANPSIYPRMPVVSSAGKFYATPMADGLRFAGTVEFAGLEAPPDYRRAKALVVAGQRMFPGLRAGRVTEWMGHRPCLPDSLPIIGPVPQCPAIMLAFGHGHNGLTGASTTGRLIADLVSARHLAIDLHPYRADRF